MAKSQRVYGQCSLAQAALSVWSRLGWNWQAGHALAVVEDSSTRSQCHGGAVEGGGGGDSGECGRVLRWRRWCLFFLFFVIFFAGGAPNAGLVAIWEDASAIGVKVCVSQDRAPTHVAGGWCTVHSLLLETYSHHHDVATKIQAATRALAFTARAVCCSRPTAAAFCARQAIHHFWGD